MSTKKVRTRIQDENRIKARARDDSKDRKGINKVEDKSKIKKAVEVKRKQPGTPVSNRVSKTQFFPSKNLYSNALKTQEAGNSSRKTTNNLNSPSTIKKHPTVKNKEETSSPHGIKKSSITVKQPVTILRNKIPVNNIRTAKKPQDVENSARTIKAVEESSSPDSSVSSDRPRTATLRKGSIVNANIVGPGIPTVVASKMVQEILKAKEESTPEPEEESAEYEADFDSYESDFEAYSSSSSTINVSNEETSSINSDYEINLQPKELGSKRSGSASTDEEKKFDSGHFDMPKQTLSNIKEFIAKENLEMKKLNNPASLSDEGFEDQKSLQFINFLDAKKRDDRRRDFDSKIVRGREILSMIKLDSCNYTLIDIPPVTYDVYIRNFGNNNSHQISVQTGEDNVEEESQTDVIDFDSKWTQFPAKFPKFDRENNEFSWERYRCDYLGVGGDQTVDNNSKLTEYNQDSLKSFMLLTGGLVMKLLDEEKQRNVAVTKNTTELPFSEGFVELNINSMESIKGTVVKSISFNCDNINEVLTVHLKSNITLIAIWNIFKISAPEVILESYGIINCCNFVGKEFVFAGSTDGTISVWNAREIVPIFTTGVGLGHKSKVVGLQPIKENKDFTKEICTLDEEGELILWTVIVKQQEVILVINTKSSLKKTHEDLTHLQYTDFVLSPINTNYAFISTNYGFIIHHFVKGGRESVKRFEPHDVSYVNCLEPCPFTQDYILAGQADGSINLYSVLTEKPLIVLSDKENNFKQSGIELIQWSKNKPFVIYVKDNRNVIHIWDLNQSDLFPTYSIPFEHEICCMKLSPCSDDCDNQKTYMAIGTGNGTVYLYQFNKEHGKQSLDNYTQDFNTFIDYVNRL